MQYLEFSGTNISRHKTQDPSEKDRSSSVAQQDHAGFCSNRFYSVNLKAAADELL